ncbi:hypothetical protein G9A89_018519 [Geosiphon pyriformis]|nr:hypothetical protein G9A89_018519 [Geosiphon pyriformis]
MSSLPETYAQRVQNFVGNATAQALLQVMERKKTNLCVSVDLTLKQEVLSVVEKVGPFVCLIKTHIDIIQDFDQELIEKLQSLQERFDFLIFEDRKFADIGNTVKLQYSSGIYKIAEWAHITNAHPIPGDGIISGLKEIGKPLGRGLLILAEMSSAGNLATSSYTDAAVAMARRNRDFVIGFISMRKLIVNCKSGETDEEKETGKEDFIYMTPGVGLNEFGDKLGQRYRTPREVILNCQSDIIIVGRGIYASGRDVAAEAKLYKEAGWNAYLERLQL